MVNRNMHIIANAINLRNMKTPVRFLIRFSCFLYTAFENIGSIGNPNFDPNTNAMQNTSVLGGVFTRDPGFTVGSSSPAFFDTEDDFLLFIGSESGRIRLYSHIKGNLEGTFDLKVENLLPYKTGSNTMVTALDLTNDGFIDLVVGNSRGSIMFFRTDIRNDGVVTHVKPVNTDMIDVRAYPNPTTGWVNIDSPSTIRRIDVFNLSGQKVLTTFEGSVDLPQNGTYILRIITDKVVVHRKIIRI